VIGAVHAAIGAFVGSLCKKRTSAFAAGAVSHAVADAVPHEDFSARLEVPLLLAALTGLAAWKGADSPEFAGALGAVLPDTEHGLVLTGLITVDQEVFPTHIQNGKYHGRHTNERISQAFIAGACVIALAVKDAKSR